MFKSWVRIYLFLWSFFLVGLMSFGVMTKAHIGAITYGPTTDFWAMSIAISKIKYGLTGGLGYQEIANKLAKHLTTTGSDISIGFGEGTMALDDNPSVVTLAIQDAVSLSQDTMHPQYVTTFAEDIGYAHFYEIAFSIFGFHAYSTHYLYFTILIISALIFALAFNNNNIGTIILLQVITSLFLVSTSSSLFCESIPSFAANRFLSTLAIIPLFHIVLYSIQTSESKKIDSVYFILQVLLFTFTVQLRSSAHWMIISLFLMWLSISVYRYRSKLSEKQYSIKHYLSFLLSKTMYRMTYAVLFTFVTLITYSFIVNSSLNKIYTSGDVSSGHMVWHSAYLGLTTHPRWVEKKPYLEQPNGGDGTGFQIYHLYQRRNPTAYPFVSTPGFKPLYKVRLYEKIIKAEFFSFAKKNPRYMLQLYFYYKPQRIIGKLKAVITAIPIASWFIALLSFIGSSLLVIDKDRCKDFWIVMVVMLFIWAGSFFPLMWAYANKHVMTDASVTTILLMAIAFLLIIISSTSYMRSLLINFHKLRIFFNS